MYGLPENQGLQYSINYYSSTSYASLLPCRKSLLLAYCDIDVSNYLGCFIDERFLAIKLYINSVTYKKGSFVQKTSSCRKIVNLYETAFLCAVIFNVFSRTSEVNLNRNLRPYSTNSTNTQYVCGSPKLDKGKICTN